MEKNVGEELERLKGMVFAWKESYRQGAPSEGESEFLAQDLLEEIEDQVYPYVRRMYECNYLSQSEVEELMQFCYEQVENLRGPLSDAEAEQDPTIWPEGREKESFGPH
jgi:hypothetical protein